MLQRDISRMINEEEDNPSWSAFIIDLDLAIHEKRQKASGSRGRTAFMAIQVLIDGRHTFMVNLDFFFWILFWASVRFNGPAKAIVSKYENWNYKDPRDLAMTKFGIVGTEALFRI